MPVDSAYTVRTQSLVHELREERDQRIMVLVGKKKFRDGSVSFSPECARLIAEINKDTYDQLQVLAPFDPQYIESVGLTGIFDHILKGYRAPSRSRSPARPSQKSSLIVLSYAILHSLTRKDYLKLVLISWKLVLNSWKMKG